MLTALKGNILEALSPDILGVHPNSYLVLENGAVVGIYPDLPENMAEASVEDYGDALILQSFADMHLHGPQYEFMGTGMDKPLLQWLESYAFPTEERYADPAYARDHYRILARDLIRNGTTRVAMFSSLHTDSTLILMEELEKAGVTGYVGKVNMDRNAPPYLCETTEESEKETLRWLEASKAFTLIKPILTPRFAPSCTERLLCFLGRLKAERDLPVQSHLSENLGEIALVGELFPDCRQYWEVYDRYGLFDGKTLMAHCVHSDERERAAMKLRGVHPVHCASSNNSLMSGISPVAQMLREDQSVCLGSDVSGGTTLSMLRTMANSISAAKDRGSMMQDADQVISIEQAYYMATSAGQSFMGRKTGFAAGERLHAVVLDDTGLPKLPNITLRERLIRAVYRLDDRHIRAVYSEGVRRF
ncbi:MAG: amidohydrolase family protein [Clostridia bacterium]|nr:amidohydrolase family protein [Clostridia bacterium]